MLRKLIQAIFGFALCSLMSGMHMQAMKNHQEINEKDFSENKRKNIENTEFINLDELFEENKNFSNNESFYNFQFPGLNPANELCKELYFPVPEGVNGKLQQFVLSNPENQKLSKKQVNLEKIDNKQSKKITRSQKEQEELNYQLINAIIDNQLEKVKNLIDKLGVDVVTNKSGWAPLHWACRNEKFKIVKFLIEQGADVNVKATEDGWTPLFWSYRNNSLDVTKLLLENGADVNVQANASEPGFTPLHWAVQCKKLELVKFLVQYGADTTIKGTNGETALDKLKTWPADKLNELCTYLLPVQKRMAETEKQKNARVFVEYNVIGAHTEQLQQGIIPLKVPEKDVAYKVTIIENREEIIKLCDKVMGFFFVPRIKPLVSTSMPNRELSEKQYRLALELFDCSKSAVLKVLTDHPEIRKQLGNLFKAMENANGKNKKRYFKDLNIRFYHDFDSRKFFKNVEK